jgi:hypothetical protein
MTLYGPSRATDRGTQPGIKPSVDDWAGLSPDNESGVRNIVEEG